MSKRSSETYNWLRPPDEDLRAAIEQVSAPGAAEPYSYLLTPAQRAALPQEAWLGAYLLTPLLRAQTTASEKQQKGAKLTLSEARILSGTMVVAFYFVTPHKGVLPHVYLHEGSNQQIGEAVGAPQERTKSCPGKERAACYFYVQSVIFKYPESKKLRGTGTLTFRWLNGEKSIPLNFDYLR